MKCILHIGTEKTGTSALQSFMHNNSDALLEQGVAYSKTLGRPGNRNISLWAMNPANPDSAMKSRSLDDPKRHGAFRGKTQDNLKLEVAALSAQAPQATYVISSEHLHSRLVEPGQVADLAAMLNTVFDDIEVICFLRPQADLLLSRVSTMARSGRQIRSGTYRASPTDPYYDYLSLYERWSVCFDRVTIVPYARHRDIVGYFAKKLGFDMAPLSLPEKENTALDVTTLALLNIVNAEDADHPMPSRERRIFYDELAVREKLSVDRDMAQTLQITFEGQNVRLAARCDDITIADLVPDWSHYPTRGNIHDLGSALDPATLRRVVIRLNAEIYAGRAEAELVRAKLAVSQNKPRAARRHLGEARKDLHRASSGTFDSLRVRLARIKKQIEKFADTLG